MLQPCLLRPPDPDPDHDPLDLEQDLDSSLSPCLEGFEDHSSSRPVLSQSSSATREIGMERYLPECPGLKPLSELELPECPGLVEAELPECPGLERQLLECPD